MNNFWYTDAFGYEKDHRDGAIPVYRGQLEGITVEGYSLCGDRRINFSFADDDPFVHIARKNHFERHGVSQCDAPMLIWVELSPSRFDRLANRFENR